MRNRKAFRVPSKRTELEIADLKPPYLEGEALAEAARCLYCHDAPCTKACPTEIDVAGFVRKVSTGNLKGAAKTIFQANAFGYSCARVCPVEVLCEGACVLSLQYKPPVSIGRLQRHATEPFLGEDIMGKASPKKTGRKVACIGAGPASITCAVRLVRVGHEVVIFEKRKIPGGLNTWGIAPYKLYADEALIEAEWLLSLGIELKTGVEVGKDVSIQSLLEKYDAIFLGGGLGQDSFLGIPGEKGPGVFGAIELIERMKTGSSLKLDGVESAAVIGGGNTAIDIARELRYLGLTDVSILYRRTEMEMPGYAHELSAARSAGVRFYEKTVPLRVLRDGEKVTGLVVARAEKARAVEGTERDFPTQMVVLAIGQAGERELLSRLLGVELDSDGCVIVDEATGRTGNPKIFAGGDCVNGGKEVVNAVAEGNRAAAVIDEMLRGGK
ncbi:MAG: NAD(P)-dependent oxidoreductase [Candidatus Eiseniibacteriota bacterium]|nr:MAG: NAD(P)-dependent oxidoreductase [Candidatus Eisenbacteria bacterium]